MAQIGSQCWPFLPHMEHLDTPEYTVRLDKQDEETKWTPRDSFNFFGTLQVNGVQCRYVSETLGPLAVPAQQELTKTGPQRCYMLRVAFPSRGFLHPDLSEAIQALVGACLLSNHLVDVHRR
jgi:hypothetical protein